MFKSNFSESQTGIFVLSNTVCPVLALLSLEEHLDHLGLVRLALLADGTPQRQGSPTGTSSWCTR